MPASLREDASSLSIDCRLDQRSCSVSSYLGFIGCLAKNFELRLPWLFINGPKPQEMLRVAPSEAMEGVVRGCSETRQEWQSVVVTSPPPNRQDVLVAAHGEAKGNEFPSRETRSGSRDRLWTEVRQVVLFLFQKAKQVEPGRLI